MSSDTQKPQALATIEVGQKGLALRTLDEMWRFSQVAVQSQMVPKGIDTPQKVMICLQAGAEVGLPPWASLKQVAVINGRPCLYGDGLLAAVLSSPQCEWIDEKVEGDKEDMIATCTTQRRGKPRPTIRTFSVDDAKRAKLWSKPGPWQEYPKRMLQMRARALCLRDAYSDLLCGMGMVEEVADFTDRPRTVDVVVSDTPSRTAALADRLTEKADGPEEEPAPEPAPTEIPEQTTPAQAEQSAQSEQSDLVRCPKCGSGATWNAKLSGWGCPTCGTRGVAA